MSTKPPETCPNLPSKSAIEFAKQPFSERELKAVDQFYKLLASSEELCDAKLNVKRLQTILKEPGQGEFLVRVSPQLMKSHGYFVDAVLILTDMKEAGVTNPTAFPDLVNCMQTAERFVDAWCTLVTKWSEVSTETARDPNKMEQALKQPLADAGEAALLFSACVRSYDKESEPTPPSPSPSPSPSSEDGFFDALGEEEAKTTTSAKTGFMKMLHSVTHSWAYAVAAKTGAFIVSIGSVLVNLVPRNVLQGWVAFAQPWLLRMGPIKTAVDFLIGTVTKVEEPFFGTEITFLRIFNEGFIPKIGNVFNTTLAYAFGDWTFRLTSAVPTVAISFIKYCMSWIITLGPVASLALLFVFVFIAYKYNLLQKLREGTVKVARYVVTNIVAAVKSVTGRGGAAVSQQDGSRSYRARFTDGYSHRSRPRGGRGYRSYRSRQQHHPSSTRSYHTAGRRAHVLPGSVLYAPRGWTSQTSKRRAFDKSRSRWDF